MNLKLENNSSIKIDDVLDSMVLFITALRIVEGNYLCLEKTEITDMVIIMAKFLYKFNLNLWPKLTYNIKVSKEKPQ